MEGAEPEEIRDHERPERREREQHPHLPAEAVILVCDLREADDGDQHPAERKHDGADLRGRVALHQRRDRDRVTRPGRCCRDAEQVAADVAGDSAARAQRDEADAGERNRGGDPEPARQSFEAEREPDQRSEDRGCAEDQRDRGSARLLERVDERDLVQPETQRGERRRAPRSLRRIRSVRSATSAIVTKTTVAEP